MSLAAYLDLVARACHPAARAGLSANAPRTTESTARRCVVVPLGERARAARSRRRLGCRDRSASSFSSIALGKHPRLAAPIAQVDSRTSRGGTAAPPSAPGTGARPSARCGQPQWARRGPSPCLARASWVFRPPVPARGSDSPTKADSRACRGSLSSPAQTLRSIRCRRRLHRHWP